MSLRGGAPETAEIVSEIEAEVAEIAAETKHAPKPAPIGCISLLGFVTAFVNPKSIIVLAVLGKLTMHDSPPIVPIQLQNIHAPSDRMQIIRQS